MIENNGELSQLLMTFPVMKSRGIPKDKAAAQAARFEQDLA
jgi:hypothetical protein